MLFICLIIVHQVKTFKKNQFHDETLKDIGYQRFRGSS